MTDTMREAFEKKVIEMPHLDLSIERTPHGLYKELATEIGWRLWQAATLAEREACAALVAGNHLISGGNGPNFSIGWEMALEASAKAIRTRTEA